MDDGRRVDHARGARVVHLLTSETYEPPSETTWGDAWWRRYIPQDWESVLLPEGWEEWTATSLPSLVYHSTKFMQGEVAPPETILQKSVLPGACWPMEGKSGMVTLKLKYPVLVEEITIDHVSKDIIPSGWRNSAPKKIKIVGYPPCHQGDKYCESLGFDRENPIDIAEFIYDVEGPSMQTFDSYYGKAMKDMSAAAQSVHNQVEEEESGSCSAEAAACTTPPRIFVAGVAVKVQDNWGQKRYTCLYRVRIHGEAA
jgi:SUN domain-containing protein 1/2